MDRRANATHSSLNGRPLHPDEIRLRDKLRELDPMKPAREILSSYLAEWVREGERGMCDSCAFRDGETRTEPLSLFGVVMALCEYQPFYCHRDLPIIDGEFTVTDESQLEPCAGWIAFRRALDAVIIRAKAFVAQLQRSVWNHPNIRQIYLEHQRKRTEAGRRVSHQ